MLRTSIGLFFILGLLWNSIVIATLPLQFDNEKNTTLSGSWNYYPHYLIFDRKNYNQISATAAQKIELPNSFHSMMGRKDGLASFQ